MPLIGQDASNKGLKIYLRGYHFGVKHLDNFIKSDINKKMSPAF